jgi:hypothetical protein
MYLHPLELNVNRLILEYSPLQWHVVAERSHLISSEGLFGETHEVAVVGSRPLPLSLRCLASGTKM